MEVARENVAYNQPPQVGFYLGYGMANPANPPMQQVKLKNK
jgi:hypothetical protein